MRQFDHRLIETKWQQRWLKERVFSVTTPSAPSGVATPPHGRRGTYVLDMFPYPSGDGLHVGHPEGYTATDIYARYRRMKGDTVLHPMGWDAFGLPTENAAIKKGTHPRMVTETNVANFKRQIQAIGFSYDWNREVNTTDPKYYRWTQWIFSQLFKRGLAYEKEEPIWWCPKDKTGLANEEVVNGCCERCGTPVEKKMLKQWMLKITAYADRLLAGLEKLDWPESIKSLQRNWIGKSEGAEVRFEVEAPKSKIPPAAQGRGRSSRLKLFIGTKNPAKKKRYVDMFSPLGIDVVTIDNMKTETAGVEVKEGDDVERNARAKARAYHAATGLPTLAIDEALFIDSFPEDQQPGPNVRRIPGGQDRPTDEDMLRYYTGAVARHGEGLVHWKHAVAYVDGRTQRSAVFTVTSSRIVAKKSGTVKAGYPLDSLLIDLKTGKYRSELTPEEERRAIEEYGRKLVAFVGPIVGGTKEALKQVQGDSEEKSVTVFTTRPDTLFGATYLVLSPEHPLVEVITTPKQKQAVEKYVKAVAAKSDLERTALEKEKTGVFTGAYAVNPVNNEKIPIWIADYVLMSYGTGAIMAVPAHDERDFTFATKYGLPIRQVIAPFYKNTTDLAVKPDAPMVRRPVAYGIIHRKRDDHYLCLQWKEHGWGSFVVGGIEPGEKPVHAAQREILEETGYQKVHHIATIDWQVHTEFYAPHKSENRYGIATGEVFELVDDSRAAIPAEEQNKHQPVWVPADRVRDFVTHANAKYIWDCYRRPSAYVGQGVMVNSGQFDGLPSEEGSRKIVEWLSGNGAARNGNVIVLHGTGGHSGKNWYPWLKRELGSRGMDVVVPDLPDSATPDSKKWLVALEAMSGKLSDRTTLIGHSLGCVAALQWLQKSKTHIAQLILIAPVHPDMDWTKINETHTSEQAQSIKAFAQHTVHWEKIRSLVDRIVVLVSPGDPYIPLSTKELFEKDLGAEVVTFPAEKAHFNEKTAGMTSFPELITILGYGSNHAERAALAKPAVNYKLRDWVFSRQRYWGEPIPLIHCEHCRQEAEATKWSLNFYNTFGDWTRLMSGEKTVETRALNPDEKDRYFGELKTGDIIKGTCPEVNEEAYFQVVKIHRLKNLADLVTHPELLKKMERRDKLPTLNELKKTYSFTPEYVERIEKNGLIAWEIKRVIPGIVPVPEEQLPVLLPDVKKYEPTGTGESPLAAISEWVNTTCPKCGGPAKRETNTMPQWAGSCWYYIRFTNPHNDEALASPEAMKAWLPVDLYVGGAEHAVLHLLYSRFWHMVLYDAGAIPQECGDEPFLKLRNQGLILGPDGEKMSKSRGNVINPDDIVEKYGADTLRMYEMFMGPFEDAKPWDTNGIVGVRRFLEKVWRAVDHVDDSKPNGRWHKYVKNISEGIEHFRLNTCVSDLMKWVNEFGGASISKEEFEYLLRTLSPFAPHLAEELWSTLGHKTLLAQEQWPPFDPEKVKEDTVTIAVQVMGKLRATLTVDAGSSQTEVEQLAKAESNVAKYLTGKPKKVIFVKDKLINFVV